MDSCCSHLFCHRNELLLEPCFHLEPVFKTVSRIKFNAVGQSAGFAPGYLVAWASVLGTVSCHRRFGDSIGGKAHRHTPRRLQIEGSSSSNTNTSANVLLGEVQAVLQLSMKGRCLCSTHPILVRLHSCLLPFTRLLELAATLMSRMHGITELL